MYVKTKKLTLAAACLALSMLLILAESVLGISTLFLLSLAGFLIGIVIREAGLKAGGAYFLASVLLSFILAPDKVKLVVYLGAEFYLLGREASWELIFMKKIGKLRFLSHYYMLTKFLIFNFLLLPIVFLLPELIMPGMDGKWSFFVILGAEAIWYIFDRAYDHFQVNLWNRMKHKK